MGPVPPPARRPAAPRLRRRPRRRPRSGDGRPIPARVFALVAFAVWGLLLGLCDWGLGGLRRPRGLTTPLGRPEAPPAVMFPEPRRRTGAGGVATAIAEALRSVPGRAPAAELGALIVPVAGVSRGDLRDQFDEPRSGGRRHQAIDILAARNTPILAASDGTIDKLFTSSAGGLTIYERDPSGGFDLYYAHLESYAPGLHEGDDVQQGQVIGYVGTSGNAPRDVPHLHFTVFRLGPERHWWQGVAVDPYPLLARGGAAPPHAAR